MATPDKRVCLLTEDEIVETLLSTANLFSCRRVLLEAAVLLDSNNKTAQQFNLTTQVDSYELAAKECEQTIETTVMLQQFTKTVDQSIIVNHVLQEDCDSSETSVDSQVKVLFNSNQLEGLITHLNDNEGAEKEANMKKSIENKMKISETIPGLRNLFVKTDKDKEKIEMFNVASKYLKKMDFMRNITQRLLSDCSFQEVSSDPELEAIHLRTRSRKTLADYYRESDVSGLISVGTAPEDVDEANCSAMSDPGLDESGVDPGPEPTDGNVSPSRGPRNLSFRSRANTSARSARNHSFRSGLLDGTRTTRNEVSGIARLALNDSGESAFDEVEDRVHGAEDVSGDNGSLDESIRSRVDGSLRDSEVSQRNAKSRTVKRSSHGRRNGMRMEDSLNDSQNSREDSLNPNESSDKSSDDGVSSNRSVSERHRVISRNVGNTAQKSIRVDQMETSSDDEYFEASEEGLVETKEGTVEEAFEEEYEEIDDEETEEIDDEETEEIDDEEEENGEIEKIDEEEYEEIDDEEENGEIEEEEYEEIDDEEENGEMEEEEYEEINDEVEETGEMEVEGVAETDDIDSEDVENEEDEQVEYEDDEEDEELDYEEMDEREAVDDNLTETFEEVDRVRYEMYEEPVEMVDKSYGEELNESAMTSVSQIPESRPWGSALPVYAPPVMGYNPIFGYRPSMASRPVNFGYGLPNENEIGQYNENEIEQYNENEIGQYNENEIEQYNENEIEQYNENEIEHYNENEMGDEYAEDEEMPRAKNQKKVGRQKSQQPKVQKKALQEHGQQVKTRRKR